MIVGAAGAALTTIDRAFESLSAGCCESVTSAVKYDVPEPVGVPLMMPVDGASVSPFGRLPVEMPHVYAGTPPVAVSVAE